MTFVRSLARFWGLILWSSLAGEFISIPKEVIGMATTCEDKSRAAPEVIRRGVSSLGRGASHASPEYS
jgi:hypothetical protein